MPENISCKPAILYTPKCAPGTRGTIGHALYIFFGQTVTGTDGAPLRAHATVAQLFFDSTYLRHGIGNRVTEASIINTARGGEWRNSAGQEPWKVWRR